MHTKAIFPGTFDPLTLGHQDLIARAAGVFDEVIVAIAMSPGKRPLFSLDERIALARQSCAPYSQVRVEGFSGLLIDFARQQGANVLVRGIRSMTDFDYENQLAGMYRQLMPELEVLFLPARSELSCVTSSLVREVALHGGDVSPFVSAEVARAVQAKQLQAPHNPD
jgi:pantetheine-phosphate adenylyltransferase